MGKRGVKKGQSSMEAAMLITVMIVSLTVFLAVTSEKLVETQENRDKQLVDDLAFVIESEMKLATAAEEGYHRDLELPTTLNGKEYSTEFFNIQDEYGNRSVIVIKYDNQYLQGYSKAITVTQKLNGTMCRGFNSLEKSTGELNFTCNCFYGFVDSDGDGYTTSAEERFCGLKDLPSGYRKTRSGITDCNDTDRYSFTLISCYEDRDRDGHGNPMAPASLCRQGCTPGYSATGDDCNDNSISTWKSGFVDADRDGYGAGAPICTDTRAGTSGFSDSGTDCDDLNASKYRNLRCFTDNDRDGYPVAVESVQCKGTGCDSPPGHKNLNWTGAFDCDDNDRLLGAFCGKRAFATSTLKDGNIGGLSGADAECQRLGALGGQWKAWLSSSTASAASRLSHNDMAYFLVDGTKIADNFDDLVDGTLDAAISKDESGASVTDDAWTGTLANGENSGYMCSNWASNSAAQTGTTGAATGTTASWTLSTSAQCNAMKRIYCLEQCNLTGYKDTDNDGYTTTESFCTRTTLPSGYRTAPNGNDCNDNDRLAWREMYLDADGDGYGSTQKVCIGNNQGFSSASSFLLSPYQTTRKGIIGQFAKEGAYVLKAASDLPSAVAEIYEDNNDLPINMAVAAAPASTVAACTDSDGVNYNSKGYVSFCRAGSECGKSFDYCTGEGLLTEYKCSNANIDSTTYLCPSMCRNGMCSSRPLPASLPTASLYPIIGDWISSDNSATGSKIYTRNHFKGTKEYSRSLLMLGAQGANPELTVRFENGDGEFGPCVSLRNDAYGFCVAYHTASSTVTIHQYNGFTNFNADVVKALRISSLGNVRYIKVKVEGNQINGKAWNEGDAEPASWQVTHTMTGTVGNNLGLVSLGYTNFTVMTPEMLKPDFTIAQITHTPGIPDKTRQTTVLVDMRNSGTVQASAELKTFGPGYSTNSLDCNDTDSLVNTGCA